MIRNDDDRNYEETIGAARLLELALLSVVAHGLFTHSNYLAGGVAVATALNRALVGYEGAIKRAATRDYEGLFKRNAKAQGESLPWECSYSRTLAKEASREVDASLRQLTSYMKENARQGYYKAAQAASRLRNKLGYEKALEMAVTELARNGITAYTYERRDGVLVNVPVDVGIRQAMERSGKDRVTAQALDIARRNNVGLVDVSVCPDARASHAVWEGKRYQLNGKGKYPNFYAACHCDENGKATDPVEGYGGYNCHHRIRLAYTDGRFSFQDDVEELERLEKLGYSQKDIRELTTKQRRLENEIRKEKRVREVLKAEGLPTTNSNKAIRGYQAQLRELIDDNSEVLHRQPWRESVYERSLKKIDDKIFPAYLNPDQVGNINAMRTAVDTWKGRASGDLALNIDAQRKHIKGTKEYNDSLAKAQKRGYPEQSYLIIDEEECQRLVKLYAGKGEPIIVNNIWQQKERCSTDDIIGYVVKRDGTKTATKNFMIHYKEGQLHIRPRNENTW